MLQKRQVGQDRRAIAINAVVSICERARWQYNFETHSHRNTLRKHCTAIPDGRDNVALAICNQRSLCQISLILLMCSNHLRLSQSTFNVVKQGELSRPDRLAARVAIKLPLQPVQVYAT